jgi:hypothetical protein
MEIGIEVLVNQLVGLRCEAAENPYGSILSLDLGPLAVRPGDSSGEKPHGWRHLTITSPWRVQDSGEVLFDWNVDGGVSGRLPALVTILVGRLVVSASTAPPAWDLVMMFENDLKLVVFGDCDDTRDDAWFILGTDGAEAVARPRVRALPS